MNLLLTLALLLPLTVAAQSNKRNTRAAQPATVDSGSFGIYLNGKRIGTEEFGIEQQADEGILTAQVAVDDGAHKAEQRSELRVGNDGTLKLYKWSTIVPAKEESVIEPKDMLLVEHITTADQKRRDVPYILPLSTMILDDNFFSHRELLVWRYLATGCMTQEGQLRCGPSHFGVLIPHQHIAASIAVELLGRDQITFKGTAKELNKIKLDDGVKWLIWVDDPENGYKVIRMSIPSGNLEVVRD